MAASALDNNLTCKVSTEKIWNVIKNFKNNTIFKHLLGFWIYYFTNIFQTCLFLLVLRVVTKVFLIILSLPNDLRFNKYLCVSVKCLLL